MELQEVLTVFGAQGVFCVLFVYTYIQNNKTNKEREDRYINIIDKFSDSIDKLTEVVKRLEDCK